MNQEDDYGGESFRTMQRANGWRHRENTHECRHGRSLNPALNAPCPHCAADSEILEEKIGLVVAGVDVLIEAKARAARGFEDDVDESREAFRHALRELVREVRRG